MILLLAILAILLIILYDFTRFYKKTQHKNYADKVTEDYFWLIQVAFKDKTEMLDLEYKGELDKEGVIKDLKEKIPKVYNIKLEDIELFMITDGFESGAKKPKTLKYISNLYIQTKLYNLKELFK